MAGIVYVDNDMNCWLRLLQKDVDGSYVNGATVTVTLGDNATSGTLTGATNTSPIIVTSANHGQTTGNQIVIVQTRGNKATNGTWTITVLDANTFSLNASAGNGTYTSGGIWYAAMANAISLPMTYQGSQGGYMAVIPYTVNLTANNTYTAVVQVSSPSGTAHFETPVIARTRV